MAEIAYQAPASCPGRAAFEQRLRRRLGAGPETRLPAALSIALTFDATQAIGEITVTSGPRSGARRRVSAASCEEAVDALTLVTALLIEPRARVTSRSETARTPSAAADGRGSSASPSAAIEDVRADEATGQATVAPSAGATAPSAAAAPIAPAPTPSESREDAASSRSSAAPVREATTETPARPPRAPAPSARRAGETSAQRARAGHIEGELALAALLALGTLPSPRPGLLGRAALALPLASRWALALALSGRALLPQRERSREGDAEFRFYAGGAALCARHTAGRLATHACAQAELGQLSAQGENTNNPRRARALWSAFGPSARAALRLADPLALHGGLELLFPTSRDRFEVGPAALFVVPRLTFRMELGLGVHFE